MFSRILMASILTVLVWWPGASAAQSDELLQVYRQGTDLFKSGRLREAEPLFLKVLRMGEKEFGLKNKNTAPLVNNLALLFSKQRRYVDAEPLFKRAIRIWECLTSAPMEQISGIA